MATNIAQITTSSEHTARLTRSAFEHRFFLTVAILFPLITVIGFAPSYYFKSLSNTSPLPGLLVHVHGFLMSAWVILFSVQACLISAKRVRLHMTLGMFSILLAAAMIVVGTATGIEAAHRGSTVPGFTPLQFMIVPLADMLIFGLLFAAAIYYRKDAATHKRMLLVTVVIFLAAPIARMPLPYAESMGAFYFFGIPILIALFLLAGDTLRNKKVHNKFALAMTLSVLASPVRIAIAQTVAWESFANWLVR